MIGCLPARLFFSFIKGFLKRANTEGILLLRITGAGTKGTLQVCSHMCVSVCAPGSTFLFSSCSHTCDFVSDAGSG